MGQFGRGIIVEVNLQCRWQVLFPSKQVLGYLKAQPLEIMPRDFGATISKIALTTGPNDNDGIG